MLFEDERKGHADSALLVTSKRDCHHVDISVQGTRGMTLDFDTRLISPFCI